MPHDIIYEIDGFYVKSWTDRLHVLIDKDYSVESVTYNVRTYLDGETTKVDVEVPTFDMKNTTIGDLTSGGYTVKGLVMDSDKGGMPFLITSTFPESTVAAIETVVTEKSADDAVYNLNGQRVGNDHKGLVIKNGKKYFEKLKN